MLGRFSAALRRAYGARLDRALLYGSRARGQNEPGSDYDVAVFLGSFDGFAVESERLASIETDILLDTGAVINALPFEAAAYEQRTGFMAEVRRDGVDI